MSRKRKNYTSEEKVAILRRHLVEKVPVSDLCDELGLNPTVFYGWQKQLFENGAAAFQWKGKRNGPTPEVRKIEKLEAKLAQKNEVLAELMEEHVQLKKELGDYDWRKRYGKVNEHNAKIPRDHWLTEAEKRAILDYEREYPLEGYRRLTFMMLDDDVAAASPATVYRLLKSADRLRRPSPANERKGKGFHRPSRPHRHWHIDFSHLNVCGTFYHLCSILDGYSRYVVHWVIHAERDRKLVEAGELRRQKRQAAHGNVDRPGKLAGSTNSKHDEHRPLDIAALRRQVSIEEVLKHLGYFDPLRGPGPQRRGPCPLHDAPGDRHRSFSVHLGKGVFRCFHPGCQAQGNTLDLWAAYHRLPIGQAAQNLAETFAPALTSPNKSVTEERNP